MAEKLLTTEFINSPEYQKAERVDGALRELSAQSQKKSETIFANEHSAHVVGGQTILAFNEQVDELGGVKDVVVRASGGGVELLNYELGIAQDPKSDRFIVDIVPDAQLPTKSMLPGEMVKGSMQGMNYHVVPHAEERWRLKFYLSMSYGERSMPVLVSGVGAPVAKVTINDYASVELGDHSVVRSELVVQRENALNVLDAVKRLDLHKSKFIKQLNRLDRALYREHEMELTSLKKSDIIQAVAKQGLAVAHQGSEHAQLASRAILGKFGENRYIQVTFGDGTEENPEAHVGGYLVDVLMPVPGDASIETPTFVLRPSTEAVDTSVQLVAMQAIKALKF